MLIRSFDSYTKSLSINQKIYFFKRRLQLFSPYILAHHPLCDKYKQEVFLFWKLNFCRGCTLLFSTTIVFSLFLIIFNPLNIFTLVEVFFIVIGVTSPTWIGLIHSFQNRRIKDLLRILLGVGWSIAIAEIWLQPMWIDKFLIFILMIGFWYVFFQLRRLQTSIGQNTLCSSCDEFSDKVCIGFKKQHEAENIYSRELSDFLQQKLTWNEVKLKLNHPPDHLEKP
ncbi:MAG: hypothetical protein ACXAC8_07390 [Candidatus Hodarchaeales archaeon]